MLSTTLPIERAVAAVPGLVRVRSKTVRGASEVGLDFRPDTEMRDALALVRARIAGAGLGADTKVLIEQQTPAVFPVLSFTIVPGRGAAADALARSRLAEWAETEVAPRLLLCVLAPLGAGLGDVSTGFLPAIDERGFVLDYWLPVGTSLEETDACCRRIEAILLETELLAACAELTKAEGEARLLEVELAFALGFARPVRLVLAEPMTEGAGAPGTGLGDLLAAAAGRRQELVAATERYAAELARAHLQAERVRFWPTVAAGPRSRAATCAGSRRSTSSCRCSTAGVPVTRRRTRRARGRGRGAQAGLARRARVALAHARGEGARAAAASVLPLAAARRSLRDNVERLFAAGEASFLEVILARRGAIEAELAAVDAGLAVAEARLSLEAAVGRDGFRH